LDGGEFFQEHPRLQVGGQTAQLLAPRDRQAISEKRNEQVRFNPPAL
jgi:hypothetical protein